jgi:hypothetical protein
MQKVLTCCLSEVTVFWVVTLCNHARVDTEVLKAPAAPVSALKYYTEYEIRNSQGTDDGAVFWDVTPFNMLEIYRSLFQRIDFSYWQYVPPKIL